MVTGFHHVVYLTTFLSVSFWNIVQEKCDLWYAPPRSIISFVHFLIWENLSSSFDQLSSVWSLGALLIIWGLREAKRVREILIHRVLQLRKSSFPTPDKNSWNHRRQFNSSWFHRKFQRDNFWQNAITNSSSKVSSNAILANVHKPKILSYLRVVKASTPLVSLIFIEILHLSLCSHLNSNCSDDSLNFFIQYVPRGSKARIWHTEMSKVKELKMHT